MRRSLADPCQHFARARADLVDSTSFNFVLKKSEQFNELEAMIQTLAMVVQSSTAATTCAAATMGDVVKKEVATEGEDVDKAAKKVDMIERKW